ncbi:MAG: MgtC/SapB family protein [Chloroflexi bacterium]|nr:MgtC/SapB family protein [Chloroflexota bacterium]
MVALEVQFEILLRILAGMLLGGLIGFEREAGNHAAGLRTHMLVAGGSAGFMAISMYGFGPVGADPSRVAAQIVTGVGFLGAGTIWRTGATVRGLTTAASIWVAAAIGMAAGGALYVVAAGLAVMGAAALRYLRGPARRLRPADEEDAD